jgi:Cu-processing system permease protein
MIQWDSIKPIALKEMNDARRNRWLIGYALVLGLLGIIIAIIGSTSTAGLSLTMFGRTTATFVNLCLFIAPLVSVTLGAGSIAGERDVGTLEHLLAQPIERSELLIGKYTGLWCALALATVAGFAPAGIIIGSLAGGTSIIHFLLFPMLAVLVASAMLAIGMFISVRSKGRAEAQTTAILLWFGFVLAYDLLLMGSLSIIRLPASALGFTLLLNPIDAARTLTILALDPELYVLGPAGAYLTETFGAILTAVMLIASLIAWTVLPLLLSLKSFTIARRLVSKTGGTTNHPVSKEMKPLLHAAAALLLLFAVQSCGDKNKADSDDQTSSSSVSKGKDIEVDMSAANIEKGKAQYQTTCAPCHGPGGKGDGPASAALNPKPRDHTNGAYMDTLTNDHIYKVIKLGGAPFGYPTMPAQPALSDEQIHSIIAYVRSLSPTYKKP